MPDPNHDRLKAVSKEALHLHDLLNDKQVEWIKREVARDRFNAVETDLLRLADENEERQVALKKIELKTKKIITHPPSPGPTLSIMLANALVAVNKIANATITPASAGGGKDE